MGCLKLTYSLEKTTSFLGVWKNPEREKSGVSCYDYGARMYDPALGRFMSPDQLGEYHYNTTPYHYGFNNPVRFIDPFGLDTVEAVYCYGTAPDHESKFDQAYGETYTTEQGGADPTQYRARHWGGEYSIDNLLNLISSFLLLRSGVPKLEDIASSLIDVSLEQKSDEEIVEESAGNNKELIENEVKRRVYVTKKIKSNDKTYYDSTIVNGDGAYAEDSKTDTIFRKFFNSDKAIDSIELKVGIDNTMKTVNVLK